MSEQNAAPITPPTGAGEAPKDGAIRLPDDHPLVTAYARQKAENESLKDKARRLDELEEAQKTEAQKLADRLAAAEAKAQAAELKALRSEIAQAKGVPAALLTGSTEDELNASADALLAFRGAPTKPPAAPPAEGVQGNVGKPIGVTDIDTQIKAANEAGDWRRALSLTNTKLAEQAGKD